MKTILAIISVIAIIGLCADPARHLGLWWFGYEAFWLAVLCLSARAFDKLNKHPRNTR